MDLQLFWLSMLGLVVSSLLLIAGLILFRGSGKNTAEITSEKIDHVSNLLKTASSEIEELNKQVTDKSRKFQELEERSKKLENLVSLNSKQVEAIKHELETTLKDSNRSNRFWTIAIGALWFIIGLIIRGFLGF